MAGKLGYEELEDRIRELEKQAAELRRTQERVRESEEKYRRFFADANDAIFIAGAKTHIILDANRRAERLIGRPRKEIVGMRQSELHPPDHAEYYEERFRWHLAKGQAFRLETEVITKDGRTVPVVIRASVISIHGIEVMQAVFRDLTEERRILDLTEQIARKTLVEKAKRVLTDRHGITKKEAMRRLQKESRRQRKKVKEIARGGICSELILD